jgi:hypothetical protein
MHGAGAAIDDDVELQSQSMQKTGDPLLIRKRCGHERRRIISRAVVSAYI